MQALANLLTKHHTPKHPDFKALINALTEAVDSGSSCLDLNNHPPHDLPTWQKILTPDTENSTAGTPGANTPLILTETGLLYLQRYHLHEQTIQKIVQSHTSQPPSKIPTKIRNRVEELFHTIEGNDQAQAAIAALQNTFTIISGGPGTGKTTTVLNILILLQDAGILQDPADCLLLAPTGKAADRLRQSILTGIQRLGLLGGISIPTDTSTIHSALGYQHNKIEFRHNAQNPLNAKVIVIDETSMVDLPLMARLLDACRPDARIILLGDKNQLSSVQVGTVLADLTQAAQTNKALAKSTITLTKSYRTQGPINAACAQIRQGNVDQAWQEITNSPPEVEGAIIQQNLPTHLTEALTPFIEKHWIPTLTDTSLTPAEKLTAIDRFRILTPTHRGPYGVEAINATVDHILSQNSIPTQNIWFPGRAIIIQKNDHSLRIYNGDTGLILTDPETQNPTAAFPHPETPRLINPARLPEVNTAWALTIHRTQGSEYDHILLIIPPAEDSPILSRELLYTGLSRAKKSATLWTNKNSLTTTIQKTVQRASGLPTILQ